MAGNEMKSEMKADYSSLNINNTCHSIYLPCCIIYLRYQHMPPVGLTSPTKIKMILWAAGNKHCKKAMAKKDDVKLKHFLQIKKGLKLQTYWLQWKLCYSCFSYCYGKSV